MENIGGGKAAPSKSAVGPIWHGHRLELKRAQKTCAAMSFSLVSLNLKEIAGGDCINQYLLKV